MVAGCATVRDAFRRVPLRRPEHRAPDKPDRQQRALNDEKREQYIEPHGGTNSQHSRARPAQADRVEPNFSMDAHQL